MKGIMLNKMPMNDDYTLSVKSVFLGMCDDFITALLRVAKRSERTCELHATPRFLWQPLHKDCQFR